MKAEDGTIDDSSDRQALEDFSEPFPNVVGAVLPLAFVIESVQFIDFSVFVIASQNGDSVSVFDLEE